MRQAIAATAVALLLGGCSVFGGSEAEAPGAITADQFAGPMAEEIVTVLGPESLRMAEQAQYEALEYGRAGSPTSWSDAKGGNRGEIAVGRTYQVNRLDCREYTHTVYVGGRANVARGTACRQPNGQWRIVG